MVGDTSGFAILAQLNMPEDISFDAEENLYISDSGNNKIKKMDFSKSEIAEIVGKKTPGYADGDGSKSSFNGLSSIKITKDGDLVVADTKNNCVRKIHLKESKNQLAVTTIAGKNIAGSEDGSLGLGSLNKPNSMVKDSQGNIFIADTQNHLIRKLDKNGMLTKFAGSTQGFLDDSGLKAKFSFPEDIIIDQEDNLFVADSGNHRIRKITKTGLVSTFAGDGLQDNDDGSLQNASFNYPRAITFDKDNNILVADSGNNSIRQILKESSHVFTLAGNNVSGLVDGPALSGSFNSPQDIAINSTGEIFVADTNNNAIRKISNDSGALILSTISGFLGAGREDGHINEASFNNPVALEFDRHNQLYISDQANNKIRKINFNTAQVSTVSGIGIAGFLDSNIQNASFNHQAKIFLNENSLLVADSNNNRIRTISIEDISNQESSLTSVENFSENKKPLIQLVNDLDFDQQNYFKMQEANPLELKVFVYDHEDEYNTVAQTQWASNLQGALTNGLRFNTKNLTAGKHNITVTAQDSKGATRSIKFNLEVIPKHVMLSNEVESCDKNGDGKINRLDTIDYGAPLKTVVEIIPPKNKVDFKKDSLKAFGGQINEVKEMVFPMDFQIIWEYEKVQDGLQYNQSYREFLKQGPELELARIPKGVKKVFARLNNTESSFAL
jgi:sugar lactone lactonase YvrE